MANISVVELTFDPDFVDPCTVFRLMETVGQDGIARRVVVPIQILASVQSNSDDLALTPDLARTEATWECITAFPLNEATETTAADEVFWQGMRFTVIHVARFGNFANGAGHYEAVMELKPVRTKAQPQTMWMDNSIPVTWTCGGVPMFWDIPGSPQPAQVTQWDDTDPASQSPETTWQDETTTTVWDVKT